MLAEMAAAMALHQYYRSYEDLKRKTKSERHFHEYMGGL